MRAVSCVVFSDVMKNPLPQCLHFIFVTWQVWYQAEITCLQLITCLDVFSWLKSREVECQTSYFARSPGAWMGWPVILAVTAFFRWMNFLCCLFLYCMNLWCTFLRRKVHLFSARSRFQSNPCFLGGNNLKYRVLIGDVISRFMRYGLSYTATK